MAATLQHLRLEKLVFSSLICRPALRIGAAAHYGQGAIGRIFMAFAVLISAC